MQLSVVIPAFNEAARIGRTLAELRTQLTDYLPDWEIRVVDDGSADDTPRIVEQLSAQDPRVVLQREPHRGKGGAVRAGLMGASAGLRFMCDADLAMPVRELGGFLSLVPTHCDIAVGSREGVGARRVGEPAYRYWMGRIFNGLVRATALDGIQDTQCGFKLFTAQAVERVFPLTTIDGWAFDIEVLFIARRQGLQVQELPIEWHYGEQSQVSGVTDPIRMVRDLLKIRANGARGMYDGGR